MTNMPDTMSLQEKLRITDTNLERLDNRTAAAAEMREAFLCEKLRAMLSAATDSAASAEEPDRIFRSIIRDEHFPDDFRSFTERACRAPADAVLPQLTEMRLKTENQLEQVSLCRMLAHASDPFYRITPDEARGKNYRRLITDLIRDDSRPEDDPARELDVRAPRSAGERIAYLRNTYTDEAYEQFAEAFLHAAPAYYSDFPGVCEALYYGRATACILPLENSVDGKLLRFYALMSKYDLRIGAMCSIASEDSDSQTNYALLRRSVTVPDPEEYDIWYMECRIILEEGMTLSRLLTAAAFYGLTLTRVDSVPVSYEDSEFTYDLILRIPPEGDLAAMLTYLYLLVPQFTLLGLYPMI
ncbi:MAG: hypothetical protein MJ175_05875 [Clostridia bacterium]|nr:hypothetical protein [Clostridia bacterium]